MRGGILHWTITATALLLAVEGASSAMSAPARADRAASSRPNVSVRDLLSLIDIGGEVGGMSISPDGRYIAFQLQQADFAANTYRSDWYVVPAAPHAVPRRVASGGDLMLGSGGFGRRNGARREVRALWSPDGKWIAYLRRDGDEVQVWRARADGAQEERVTNSSANVTSFGWRPDSKGIYFEVDRVRAEMARADREEGVQGYLLDDRFMPDYSTRPLWFPCNELSWLNPVPASEPCLRRLRTVVFGSSERDATPAEDQAFKAISAPGRPPNIDRNRAIVAIGWNDDHTRAAWLENPAPKAYAGFKPPLTLYVDGRRCSAEACTGQLAGVWWRGSDVVFLRNEGWAHSLRALYIWPGKGVPRRIYRVDGTLTSCGIGQGRLICLLETPKTPRRIVAIDTAGRVETIFDPNPGFKRFALGSVEKIDVTDGFGNQAFGHLVYPPDYDARHRYPLVVVQYRSKGFLRGGVGNEYPIYPLGAAGFLVYSTDQPEDDRLDAHYGMAPWDNLLAYAAKDYGREGYRMRRGLGAIDAALDELECRGALDPSRVGITGLSEGDEVLDYALVHSTRFAAAASTGLNSPASIDLAVNSLQRALVKAQWQARSLPEAIRTASEVYSLAAHLDRFRTPLLLQLPDHELIDDLPDYVALKDAGKPVEAYVFPDEYHVKYRPLHKLAVGERVIDWFRFWLQNHEDPAPGKASQYARWRALRQETAQLRVRSMTSPRPRLQCRRGAAATDRASAPVPRE